MKQTFAVASGLVGLLTIRSSAGPAEDLIRRLNREFSPGTPALSAARLPEPPPAAAPSLPTPKVLTIPLRENWDDAVSWDITPTSQRAYPNPSSNPWAELLIGDSSAYYKMPNIRTYFRFKLALPADARILGARLIFHCSAGGETKPKLDIHYIDLPDPDLRKEPWTLPLSSVSVAWDKEEHDWTWKTHEVYQTPDLAPLVQDFISKYGPDAVIGLEIVNRPGNVDNFKGLTSFDDEPAISTRLEIEYRNSGLSRFR